MRNVFLQNGALKRAPFCVVLLTNLNSPVYLQRQPAHTVVILHSNPTEHSIILAEYEILPDRNADHCIDTGFTHAGRVYLGNPDKVDKYVGLRLWRTFHLLVILVHHWNKQLVSCFFNFKLLYS